MLERAPLKLHERPIYTASDMDHAIRVDRRRTRKAIRLIWVTSMLVTVMVCAVMRKQPWIGIEWYWIPLAGVTINALYFWGMIRLLFPSVPKEGRV